MAGVIAQRKHKLIRVSVVGTGSLGKEHARIYKQLHADGLVHFAGVYDSDGDLARKHAGIHGVTAFTSLAEAANASDAFSIVTPTSTHFEIATTLLEQGKHVLVEKPMTETAAQAAALVQLGKKHSCIIQVGHVERFNPVFNRLQEVAKVPRFIEAHRLSPYPGRSTDIGVVLDLMIHDLDVVLAFVRSKIVSVDAVGISVLSTSEDIANARLKFENGCVANLTASRISPERMRKIRVFSGGEHPSYVSLDYREQKGFLFRLAKDGEKETPLIRKLLTSETSAVVSEFAGKRIVREPVQIEREEPLKLELIHFIECVELRQTPIVSGEEAVKTIELALEITRIIQSEGSR